MDLEALRYIAVGMLSFGMLGAAIGVGNIFAALLDGISRNPKAADEMRGNAFIGAAFAEAMGLFCFVLAIMLMFM